jgi:hypothetical protein
LGVAITPSWPLLRLRCTLSSCPRAALPARWVLRSTHRRPPHSARTCSAPRRRPCRAGGVRRPVLEGVLAGTRGYPRGLSSAGGWEAAAKHWAGTRGYSRYRSGTGVHGCCGTAESGAVWCCRAQARTCTVSRAATRARRAIRGSRPRTRAATPRTPWARPRVPGRSLSCRTILSCCGAATLARTVRTSTPTRSAASAATLPSGCCAPPPVRRCLTASVLDGVLTRYSQGTQERALKGYSKGTQRVLERDSRRKLQGYSQQWRNCFGCLWQYSWKLVSSARKCCAHSEYGSTYRVLKGYSQPRRTYSRGTPGVPTLRGALPGGGGARARAATGRVLTGYSKGADRVLSRVLTGYSRGTPRVLVGCSRVLTGYSQGADRVLIGYSRGTPRVLIGCSRVLTGYSQGADRVLTGTHGVLQGC